MTFIRAENPFSAWIQAVNTVLNDGVAFNNTTEVSNMVVSIDSSLAPDCVSTEIYNKIVPKASIKRARATLLEEGTFRGKITYWSKLISWRGQVNQIEEVIRRLVETPGSKHLSCTMLDPTEDWKKHGYMNIQPCMSSLEFRIRDNRLNVTALFRSQDVLKITYADYCALGIYLTRILGELRNRKPKRFNQTEVGTATVHTVTAFIYNKDRPLAKRLLSTRK